MHLQAGQKILIQAGAGGVGTFAIQLAKSVGAYVATTAGEAGAPLVQSLGADRIINYHLENFAQVLHDSDAVLDIFGRARLAAAIFFKNAEARRHGGVGVGHTR